MYKTNGNKGGIYFKNAGAELRAATVGRGKHISKGYTTTKAFIDAIGKLGYEYAQKALDDLKSKRESDQMFKKELLANATEDAIPQLNDIV